MFAEVIIPLSIGGTFTYILPNELEKSVHVGSLVMVPFAGNKLYTGLVAEIHNIKPEGFQVKEIDSIADETIHFSEKHLEFLKWISEYYIANSGDVLRAALPVAFRLESVTYVMLNEESEYNLKLTPSAQKVVDALKGGVSHTIAELQKLTGLKGVMAVVKQLLNQNIVVLKEQVDPMFKPKSEAWVKLLYPITHSILLQYKAAKVQLQILKYLYENSISEISKRELLLQFSNGATPVRELVKKGVLAIEEREVDEFSVCEDSSIRKELSSAQAEALQTINEQFRKNNTVLLHGVTSSGKTEVYIKLIEQELERGRQTLFLLPEIALTIQIIQRLRAVFGDRVAVYHSGMSDRERAEIWRRQCSNNPYGVILGVRSSLFLPYSNLGLIIVDEEHDASYKQREPSPRYSGRDGALMLARIHGAKSLLGSATPSLESYKNAIAGKFGLCELTTRYAGVAMPEIVLADLADARKRRVMNGSFTPTLIAEMKRVLESGYQVILFQNRRGYSTFVKCDSCGHVPQCSACDVSLTYYKGDNRMMCRYCGRITPIVLKCKNCTDGSYKMGRAGTEKIEEEIAKLFPGYPIDRIDTDSMSNKRRFRESIANFESGKTKILIGTQMVAKGLDFGGVKLVGVIDADSLIHLPDFRAEERAFAQLLQVSGRCGRRDGDGVVVIQTSQPESEIFNWIRNCDYKSMFNSLAYERKEFNYPPFARAIGLEFRHKEQNSVRKYANQVALFLREKLGNGAVEGPAEPEISKIGQLYRVTMLLKLVDYNQFMHAKLCLKACFEKLDKEYRVIIDIDTY